MLIWNWTLLAALVLVVVGAFYVRLRWRRAPQAYRAMIVLAVCYFVAGSLLGAWVPHLTEPNTSAPADAWGPRFLVTATMVCLVVVVALDDIRSPCFVTLALVGSLIQVPPLSIGPHSSLMAVHLRNPTKIDPITRILSPITLDDTRFNPVFSQVTARFERLFYKISNGRLEGEITFLSSFESPLRPEDIQIDIFWLFLHALHR
jgi:hypothetical protein